MGAGGKLQQNPEGSQQVWELRALPGKVALGDNVGRKCPPLQVRVDLLSLLEAIHRMCSPYLCGQTGTKAQEGRAER